MNNAIISVLMVILLGVNPADAFTSAVVHSPELIEFVHQQDSELAQIQAALSLLKVVYPDWENHYVADVWDCSEMSDMVRWHLRNCGIETQYMYASNESPRRGHLFLYTESGIWIECTSLTAFDSKDQENAADLKRYKDKYDTIRPIDTLSLLVCCPKDMDWWCNMPTPHQPMQW